MSQLQSHFVCNSCGKQFRWKPEIAGKTAKCVCGAVLKVPAATPADDEGLYDIAQDDPPPAPSTTTARTTVTTPPAPPPEATKPPSTTQTTSRAAATAGGLPYYQARPVKVADEGAASAAKPLIALGVVLVLIGAVIAFRFLLQGEEAPQLGDDARVLKLIKEEGATELVEWLNGSSRRLVMGMTRHQAEEQANKFYEMGAKQVLAFGGVMTKSLAIELPDDPRQRKALFDWEHQWHTEMFIEPATDVGQKYLLLQMRI